MAESSEKPIKSLIEMVGNYPAKDLPIIFADHVPSTSWQGGVAKFYLMRNDPSISADLTHNAQLVAQIVMPIHGFALAAVFFEEQLKRMIEDGTLKPEAIEQMRASYRVKDAIKS